MDIIHFTKYPGTITDYAAYIHTLNRKWWYTAEGVRITRSHPEMLALVMSELAEALEGLRKDLKDDHLPEHPMVSVELADTVIRLLDYAGAFSLPLRLLQGSFFPSERASDNIWAIMLHVAAIEDTFVSNLGYHISEIIDMCRALMEHLDQDNLFWDVVYDKLVYNATRPDHSYEARALEGGKAF